MGYLVAALLEAFVALAIVRGPNPRTFILGLAASVLVAFTFLTAMHERYAFGALVFLGLLLREPATRAIAVAFGVVFTLNLVAAVPPDLAVTSWLVVGGLTGILGSLGILLVTVAALHQLSTRDRDAQPVPT
jgi:hypothetical protein